MEKNTRYAAAVRATIVNSSTNLLLAFLKIIVGSLGHSAALVADGIHSFADLITDILVLIATKIGGKSPDEDHPYGHRRVETVASIILSIIIGAVGLGIAYDAAHRIIAQAAVSKPHYPVVIMAFISILANEFLYYYTMHEGNKSDSDLLRSNAWHNRSDALVSIIVLVSVIGSMLGAPYLDSVGALIIAVLILVMAIKLTWKSLKELVDTGVEVQLLEKFTRCILQIPGVNAIHQLRTRQHGSAIFLDVHVEVNPSISISEGHYISEQVSSQLMNSFNEIHDVVVHIDPESDQRFFLSKELPNRSQIEKVLREHWKNNVGYTQIKKIILHYLNGKLSIEVYLPFTLLRDQSTDGAAITAIYTNTLKNVKYIDRITVYFY